jgi:S-adenosyl methyltransferase
MRASQSPAAPTPGSARRGTRLPSAERGAPATRRLVIADAALITVPPGLLTKAARQNRAHVHNLVHYLFMAEKECSLTSATAAWEVLRALESAAAGGSGVAAGLVRWCAGKLSGRVRVVEPDRVGVLERSGVDAGEVRALARGRVPGPVLGRGVVVVAVGRASGSAPGGVLVAERELEFGAAEVEVLTVVARGVGLLRWVAGVAGREARLSGAAAGIRVAALQQLMAGDLVRAGRTVEPLVPGLVAAGAGAVAICECAPGEDRAGLALEVEDTLGGEGLVVLCPVSDRQVIVIYPAGGGRPGLAVLLESVLARVPGRPAGVSTIMPWHSTSAAYEAAVEALAQARGAARGSTAARRGAGPVVRVHDGRPPLTERLGADARIWSAMALQPLEVLPAQERAELLHMAQQTLWWGPEAGSRLVGMHRDTLTARLDDLAALVGADRSELWQQAGLYLAVRMAGLPPPVVMGGRRIRMTEILNHRGARKWAAEILTPVSALKDGAVVRQTAAAWVRAGLRPGPAMAELGVSKATLYRRLKKVAAAAHLDVTSYLGPALDLALALAISGDVEMGNLPTAARRLDGPTRGGPVTLSEDDIDTSSAHTARMYDYYLGGRTNFTADRDAAEAILHDAPYTVTSARENRAYMHRATKFAAQHGIRQFLDIGTGIPTSPNLHEVAQAVAPDARVVYLDNDPIVLAHARALLATGPRGATAYAEADLRDGATLYDLPEVRATLDLSQPIALSLHAVLHFLPGDHAYTLVRDLAAPLATGSLISITHGTADFDPDVVGAVIAHYNRVGQPTVVRTKAEIQEFADRAGRPVNLVEPGIVGVPQWRPGDADVAPPPYHVYAMLLRLT